jgi:hypothetical protein
MFPAKDSGDQTSQHSCHRSYNEKTLGVLLFCLLSDKSLGRTRITEFEFGKVAIMLKSIEDGSFKVLH